jgi:hypothetical protein
MSDENISDEGEGIKDLRKQYAEQKKANEQLATELAAFRAEKRTATVAEVLKAKGLPAKAASLYTGDDASEDAVGKWVESYADVFGVTPQASVNDENAAAAQRVSDASFGSGEGINSNGPSGQRVLGDPAEIERAIKSLPYDKLVELGYMPATGQLYNRSNH